MSGFFEKSRFMGDSSNLLDRYQAHSAAMIAQINEQMQASNAAMRKKNELERKAAEATIELNERTKEQNELLRRQVSTLQTVNEALRKKIEDGIRPTQGKDGFAMSVSVRPDVYEYDVFVSHANDNKRSFVDSLKANLDHLGIRVWYDSAIIDWGDDWKLKIMDGLAKCRFGIVVLSPEFIDREWTENELFELLNRQNESHDKVVLPLLYNLSIAQMKNKYPDLAPIQARTVCDDEDAKDVVIDFARIFIRSLRA